MYKLILFIYLLLFNIMNIKWKKKRNSIWTFWINIEVEVEVNLISSFLLLYFSFESCYFAFLFFLSFFSISNILYNRVQNILYFNFFIKCQKCKTRIKIIIIIYTRSFRSNIYWLSRSSFSFVSSALRYEIIIFK